MSDVPHFKIYQSGESAAAIEEGACSWVLALIRPGVTSLALRDFDTPAEAGVALKETQVGGALAGALLVAGYCDGLARHKDAEIADLRRLLESARARVAASQVELEQERGRADAASRLFARTDKDYNEALTEIERLRTTLRNIQRAQGPNEMRRLAREGLADDEAGDQCSI